MGARGRLSKCHSTPTPLARAGFPEQTSAAVEFLPAEALHAYIHGERRLGGCFVGMRDGHTEHTKRRDYPRISARRNRGHSDSL